MMENQQQTIQQYGSNNFNKVFVVVQEYKSTVYIPVIWTNGVKSILSFDATKANTFIDDVFVTK